MGWRGSFLLLWGRAEAARSTRRRSALYLTVRVCTGHHPRRTYAACALARILGALPGRAAWISVPAAKLAVDLHAVTRI